MLGTAKNRLKACRACRDARFDLPPIHQHQGETATGDKLKWERGLMHHPVEKYTPGRTHDGTVHVWVHPSVVGNSFGGKLFVEGSLICKHGAQGGQTGWAVARRSTWPLTSWSARCNVPCQSRSWCNAASCGQNFGPCCGPLSCLSQERLSWCSAARRPHAEMWRRSTHRSGDEM